MNIVAANISDSNKLYYSADNQNVTYTLDENGVLTISGVGAFRSCTSLTEITIPDSVTSISATAFRFCEKLTDITLSDNLQAIGSSAFDNTGYYNNASNRENGALYIGRYLISLDTTFSGSYSVLPKKQRQLPKMPLSAVQSRKKSIIHYSNTSLN